MNSLGFTDTGFGKGQQKFGLNNNFLVKSKNMEEAKGFARGQDSPYTGGVGSKNQNFQNGSRARQGGSPSPPPQGYGNYVPDYQGN